MNQFSLSNIIDIINRTPPYRGSDPKRYPWARRSQTHKMITVDEVDGEEVFRVHYGHNYPMEVISEGVYLANRGNSSYVDRSVYGTPKDSSDRYYKINKVWNELGIVRHDNTFEFTNPEGYRQGANQIMSGCTNGFLHNSSRHGGMVYRSIWGGSDKSMTMHPMFKGFRVNCQDWTKLHESSRYRLYGNQINRKVGSEYLKPYANFYKIAEVMMKAMDTRVLLETGIEIAKEHGLKLDSYYLKKEDKTRLFEIADENKSNTPLDSAILFAIALEAGNFYNKVFNCSQSNSIYGEWSPHDIFLNMKRHVNKKIFRSHPDILKKIELEAGKYYPASDWGVEIVGLDGKPLVQY